MFESIEHQHSDFCSVIGAPEARYCEEIPELYLRVMVDSYSTALAVVDETGTILYVNRPWREFAIEQGFEWDLYAVGSNYLEARRRGHEASLDESEILADGIKQVLLGRKTEFQRECLTRSSLGPRWIVVQARRFDLPRACRVLITHQDITESRKTSEARRQEAERLQLLLSVTRILPWEADFSSSLFTYVGDQATDLLGYPRSEWYEPGFWAAHLHPDDRERAMARAEEYANTRDNYELEYRLIAKDGRAVWLHNLISVIREGGQPKTIRGFSIDITESKQNEAALRHLSGRLINAQEEERRRVARELHDDLNQRMALLSIELEQLAHEFDQPVEMRSHLASVQTQVREISADIHRLSYRLHPSKLDHLGLAAAVKSLCHEISAKGSLEVEFRVSGFPANLPKDVTLCVFRIAQEGLRNCVKHSGANFASVNLQKNEKEILLSVSDDGCGFDTESKAMKTGLGFTSMQERLRIVDGEIKIRSRPRHGTVIEVSVPVGSTVETGYL